MGCASSAPLMGEGGALGDMKNAAGDMVESGEHALHEMGDAAEKMVHNAIDGVKGVVSSATEAVSGHVGAAATAATAATHSLTQGIKKEADTLVSSAVPPDLLHRNGSDPDACRHIPLKGPDGDMAEMIDDIMNTPQHSPTSQDTVHPLEKFKPTPVPSFDKPPTPSATMGSLADVLEVPMEKIDEAASAVTVTLDDMTNDLLRETEAVATEVKTSSMSFMKQKLPPLEDIKTELMKTEAMESVNEVVAPVVTQLESLSAAPAEATAGGPKEVEAPAAHAPPADDPPTDEEGDDADLEYDLRPTKWEALADAIVELPPRMSIDLGTGQLYAVVGEDEPTPGPRARGRAPHKEHAAEIGAHNAAS